MTVYDITTGAPRMSITQEAVYRAVKDFWREHGYSPSVRDIQNLAGITSTSVVAYSLRGLRRKHLVTFDEEVARSIRVLGACPWCGCEGHH